MKWSKTLWKEGLKSYALLVGLLLLFVLILKAGETIRLLMTVRVVFVPVIANSFLQALWSVLLPALCLFPVFILGRRFSERTTYFLFAFLCGLYLLFEISLTIYALRSGFLMGRELMVRPLQESWMTIVSVVPGWAVFLFAGVSVFGFLATAAFLRKKRIGKILLSVLVGLSFLSPLLFVLRHYTEQKYQLNPVVYAYISGKSYHCLSSWSEYMMKPEFVVKQDKELLLQFLKEHPEWEVPDIEYPFERKVMPRSVLAPYFRSAEERPNVVLVIVESWGDSWFRAGSNGVSFTPFLDSLSRHALYWKNCLTTTPRSFGAVPSITGSLPHGVQGFQFGEMPDHNSLIKILKNNDYRINAFYAGDFTFDGIYEYLEAQKIDYFSPFFQEAWKDYDPEREATYWGYQDEPFIRKTLSVLEQEKTEQPVCNLVITISAHENLSLVNKQKDQLYKAKARQLIEQLPIAEQATAMMNLDKIASIVYTDDCLRLFMNRYREISGYEQTIFVFTGDHSGAVEESNILGYFHVPLLIWSPLLEHPQTFPAVVSHLDIAPSIAALLAEKYGLLLPEQVHWVGQELDTAHLFRSQQRLLFLLYARQITDMVYRNYYVTDQDLYRINENMEMEKLNSKNLQQKIREKRDLYIYMHQYVYLNDKLTQNPLYPKEHYHSVLNYEPREIFTFQNPPNPPKNMNDAAQFYIVAPTSLPTSQNKKIEKVRISVSAEVMYEGLVEQDQFMSLVLECHGEKMTAPTQYKDKLSKFFLKNRYTVHEWVKMKAVKEFALEGSEHTTFSVSLLSAEKQELWLKDHKVFLRNVCVEVTAL